MPFDCNLNPLKFEKIVSKIDMPPSFLLRRIDQHLSRKSNTENICKKICSGISAIGRVKPYVSKETLVLIYYALVRPYFDYCCEVWDVFGETQSK